MLTFNHQPPTAETTEVNAKAIHLLAYGIENRCINGVAEACAAVVLANQTEHEEVVAIGEKIGAAIEEEPRFSNGKGDRECFVDRYNRAISVLANVITPAATENGL